MSRERLMAQQRARVEALRKKKAAEAAKKKKEAEAKKKAKDKPKASSNGAVRSMLNIDPGPQTKSKAALKPRKPEVKPKAKPKAKVTSKPAPKHKSKVGAAVLALGGGNVRKVDKKPEVAKSKKDMPYQGVFPGTPEKTKKKSTPKRNVRGAAARTNRSNARKNKASTATGSEKQVRIGNKTVTMVYNGSKWVTKK